MGKIQLALKIGPWVIVALLGLLCWHYRGEINALELDAQTQATEYQKALVSAQEQARQSEQQLVVANTNIDAAYQKGKEDAQASADKQLSEYRAGNLRLRKRLAATRNMSCSSSTASQRDDSSTVGLLDSDVEFLVRFGREADDNTRQLAACQAVIKSYQK